MKKLFYYEEKMNHLVYNIKMYCTDQRGELWVLHWESNIKSP